MTVTKHNLNLSPKYAPTWGPWEIAREFICNAIDADPEGYTIQPKGSDQLTITTRTAPGLAELFMIGEGSKRSDDDNIGQFGEGAKIAALVATRMGSVEFLIPGSKIAFSFEDSFGTPSLNATITDDPHELGLTVNIRVPGVAASAAGKILGKMPNQPISKTGEGPMQVFCKGVWICQHDSNSLFNWNLNHLELNRDRGMVSGYHIRSNISNHGLPNMTDEQLLTVLGSDGKNEESRAIENLWRGKMTERIEGLFNTKYGGANVVLATPQAMENERAKQRGFTVVEVSEELGRALKNCGIKDTSSVAMKSDGLEAVDIALYASTIAKLRKLDAVIKAPSFSVSVFGVSSNANIMGMADLEENRIWLSERLFIEGNLPRIVQTYLHEVAHFLSGATDGTRSFEDSLDWIAATFAMLALTKDEEAEEAGGRG